jgi:hypothetical protein
MTRKKTKEEIKAIKEMNKFQIWMEKRVHSEHLANSKAMTAAVINVYENSLLWNQRICLN